MIVCFKIRLQLGEGTESYIENAKVSLEKDYCKSGTTASNQ